MSEHSPLWSWPSTSAGPFIHGTAVRQLPYLLSPELCGLYSASNKASKSPPRWRVLPSHLFAQKEPVLLFISCAAVGAVSYISVYYIPIYFQFTQGDNAIRSAVRLLPFIFLLITTIPTSGAMMSHVGYYKPWYLGGSIIALIPAVLMSKSRTDWAFPVIMC